MTLDYRVIVKRYPFPNGVVGGSIPTVKSSLYLKEKKLVRHIGSQEATHRKVGSKPHDAPPEILSMVGPTCSNSRWSADIGYLFIYAKANPNDN